MKKLVLSVGLVLFMIQVTAYSQSSLDQGVVAYYPFNSTTVDSSGFGNNGTPVNISYIADRNGVTNSALHVTGSNSYVRFPDSVFGASTPGFTWSVWAQPEAGNPGTGWNIITHGAVNGETGVVWNGSGYTFAAKFANSGWESFAASHGSSLVHLVCVYQRGARMELWIDGQLANSIVPPNEDLFVLYGYPNYSSIGAALDITGVHSCFKGTIDDVKIYNRALTTNEVHQLFALDSVTTTTSVAQQSDAAPGIAGAKFVSTGVPAINDLMHVAFQAVVTGSTPTFTSAIGVNNSGIWADDGSGNRQLVIRSGSSAPGTVGAVFASMSDPVYNNNNAVAFIGTLRANVGDAVTSQPVTSAPPVSLRPGRPTPVGVTVPAPVQSLNFTGIWSNDSGVLHLVARQGTQAPGLATGVLFNSFTNLVLPDQGGVTNNGGVVFLASVTGPGSSTQAKQGIWAVDLSGNLQLVVSEGSAIQGKTVSSISFLSPGAMVTGQTSNFSQSTGNILYKAIFTDGSWGIYKVIFP